MPTLIDIIGYATLAKVLWNFICFVAKFCKLYVLPTFGLRTNLKKLGEYAVVTGATDGIGKGLAKSLAKNGMNVILISRSESKLEAVAKEISEVCSVEVRTIAHDFTEGSFEKVEEELKGVDVGVLVNNVGLSYDHPSYFLEVDDARMNDIRALNIGATLQMTKLVLEGMSERKRGLIVHLSSASALVPTPLLAVYSASKIFVDFFGRALNQEYKSLGITSQIVTPFYVATKMSKMRPTSPHVPDVDSYAQSVVSALGLYPTMTGYWSHELILSIASCFPQRTMSVMFSSLKSTRARWLKKQEARSKEE